ncbi:IS66 family transposase [Consotaella aegiceratis]|uniref:IS66 family transposase n=1 Tax=Consotaella aegiceratis TaxID=3097961 RepID=UPI002F41C130
MPIRPDQLPQDPAELARLVIDLTAQVDKLTALLGGLRTLIFASRSERLCALSKDQMALDLGDLAAVMPAAEANDNGPPDQHRQKQRRGREARRNIGALPAHLPRVEEVIEPAVKTCPCCGGALHRIGEDVREALGVVPASYCVKRRIFPKYVCRACVEGVVQAKAPARIVEGGMVENELVAQIAVAKFARHLPVHRQVQMMAAQGIVIDRTTPCLWLKRLAWWLRPLYDRQLEITHAQARIFCDETPLPVLDPGRRRTKRGQFWAHAMDDRPWGGPAPPAVTYVYAASRSARELARQLAAFDGILQVDGYRAYKTHARTAERRVALAFCFAHARRKFVEAHKITGSPFAAEVIDRLADVYGIEARIRGRSAQERRAVRQAQTRPILERLEADMKAVLGEISRQSKLAQACRYTLEHWTGLTRFLADGRIEIDSNIVERNIRPISLGRKNHLFAGSEGGAQTWAILASLINTAKLNGIDPQTWLLDVVERIVSGRTPINRIDELLASNWKPAGAAVAAA